MRPARGGPHIEIAGNIKIDELGKGSHANPTIRHIPVNRKLGLALAPEVDGVAPALRHEVGKNEYLGIFAPLQHIERPKRKHFRIEPVASQTIRAEEILAKVTRHTHAVLTFELIDLSYV